jgi:DNA-binding MarR family transcriptional regulator
MPEQFYDPRTYKARDSIGYYIRRLQATLPARIEASFASHEFTLLQWILLMHLRDGLARTASDIARELHHDSGALTRVLDQLEGRGLVTRRRSSTDRRVVELDLTPKGRRTVEELLPTVVEELNAALAPLTRAEFTQFERTLKKVERHLRPAAVPARGPEAPAVRRPSRAAKPAGRRNAR